MIVGTAGHIDHGKTTLVKALTGVDTDRLPEEKKRGISIELGYAFLDAPNGQRIAFIDVPGHERLVHTMLSGATGIDFALLLVAADDGVMPQTREHLAVLSLLGIARGAVLITKVDRAEPARVDAVHAQVAALLHGSTLRGAPVLDVSAPSGVGVAEVRALLVEAAAAIASDDASAPDAETAAFRLAVDRVFTLDGVGTVATGSVHSGRVAIGDELMLVPPVPGVTARVRSLHAQNRSVTVAQAGQRCAVGLAGVAREQVARGQWLVAPAAAMSSTRLDCTLTLWHDEARALRSGTPVHVHIGSAQALGSVAVLDVEGDADGEGDVNGAAAGTVRDSLAPGQRGRVQLMLREPIGAWWGDRVVLRDAAASRTLAGGRVLDAQAPARYRRTPQRLAELDALAAPTPVQRLSALLAVAPQGVDLRRYAAAQGLPAVEPLVAALPAGVVCQREAHHDAALGAAQAEQASAAVLAALARFHAQQPDELGPDAARLRRLAQPRLPEGLWRALLLELQRSHAVAVRGAFVHLPAHGVQLSALDQRLAQKVAPLLAQAGFEGAWVRDLARDTQESEALLRTTLARLAQRGELHQVVKDLYLPVATMARLAAMARQLAGQGDGTVAAAAFRDATGLGRKRAIQILECLDRVGLTRRVGETHKLRADSTVFESAAA